MSTPRRTVPRTSPGPPLIIPPTPPSVIISSTETLMPHLTISPVSGSIVSGSVPANTFELADTSCSHHSPIVYSYSPGREAADSFDQRLSVDSSSYHSSAIEAWRRGSTISPASPTLNAPPPTPSDDYYRTPWQSRLSVSFPRGERLVDEKAVLTTLPASPSVDQLSVASTYFDSKDGLTPTAEKTNPLS
ncbi:Protein of unknown function [Pyronema omphalodes CBS 100304]|uniref:Uncharacterized protein n=1 Tax=Pyronema omphalodes (strain CBS 100304) TaxID=1076935 RepID=U4LF80_PYROM|nr:Protein of unknown function [Pyronema omphalodes CBS 100304]